MFITFHRYNQNNKIFLIKHSFRTHKFRSDSPLRTLNQSWESQIYVSNVSYVSKSSNISYSLKFQPNISKLAKPPN